MSDLNNCTIVGRIVRDAEMKQVGANGTTLVTFTIANNTGYGQYAKTNFFAVNAWGKQAQSIVQYLTKGKQVGVTGTMENNSWTGQDGVKHDSWVIKAMGDICLMASPKSSETSTSVDPEPVF